jgi:Uma2 family endonuclease
MSSLPVPLPRPKPAPRKAVESVDCAIFLPNLNFVLPASAHYLEGFRAWNTSPDAPEHVRICFLDGEIFIDMSGEEIETHGQVKLEVTLTLGVLNKKHKRGRFFPDGTQMSNVEANLCSLPDAAFATWESLDAGRVRLVPRQDAEGQYLELEGTPDWVMEILSDSSVRKDTRRLRELYHRAGVPEYWLIDARGEEIVFQILVRGDTDYEPAEVGRGGWQTSRVFGRRFRLTRRRGRRDLWEYTLQTKGLR